MIVYNVLEEIKIALYLISLGIFIPTNYDLLKLIECKQKVLTIILKCLVSFFLILLCSLFTYKLKEGYVPQYGILIFVLGLFIYFLILRKSFLLKLDKIKKIINLIYHKFTWIFKPLRIFKTTILLVKQKSKNLYIKMLYKRKKM